MKDNKVIICFMKNWIIPACAILIICSLAFFVVLKCISQAGNTVEDVFVGHEGKVTTITESELDNLVKKSDLYLIEYPHNGYVEVKDSKGNVDYYVAYHGSVKAGIDFTKVECTLDEENNVINIKLPELIIDDPTVDVGSMDYIFINKKCESETVAHEAYDYALQDLKNQIQNDELLRETALESAKTTEKALIEPWIDKYGDEKYEINIY